MKTIALWIIRRLLRYGMKYAIKESNKTTAEYFDWQRSRKWRRWGKKELRAALDWAIATTPKFQGDDDLFRCLAWTLESDEMERHYNQMVIAENNATKLISVHAVGGYKE